MTETNFFPELFSLPIVQQLLRSLGEGIVISDHLDRILYVNPVAEEILGAAFERIKGMNLLNCHKCSWKVEEVLKKACGSEPYRGEMLVGQRWLHVTATPIFSEEKVRVGSAMVVSDITVRRQLEEKLQQNFLELSDRQKTLDLQISLARQIQKALQPPAVQETGGLRLRFWNRQSQIVGGDFAGVYPGENQTWIIFGDIMGKGIFASQFVPLMMDFISEEIPITRLPSELLHRVNQRLVQFVGDRFSLLVTMLALCWDSQQRLLSLAIAGHESPALLKKDGTIEKSYFGSIMLGVSDSSSFQQIDLPISPGDALLLFSDGLTEPKNRDKPRSYQETVQEFLKEIAPIHNGGKDVFATLAQQLEERAQSVNPVDDQTIMQIDVQ